MRLEVNMNKDGILYYPPEMKDHLINFPYAVIFSTIVLRATSNSDNIRKKINKFGLKDFMLVRINDYNNKKNKEWQVRFKTKPEQDLFVSKYRGE